MAELIDLYDTYTLLMAIQKIPLPSSFLRDTFFAKRKFSPTEHCIVDFRKQQRFVAKFVDPNVGPQVMQREGFVSRDFVAPWVGGTRIITVDDVLRRWMAEAPFTTKEPVERAAELINIDLLELDAFVARQEELMCVQTLLNGAVNGYFPSPNGDIAYNLNFGTMLGQSINSTNVTWSSSGDPLADLTTMFYNVAQQSSIFPNMVVMDPTAARYFMENTTMKSLIYSLRGDSGNQIVAIKPEMMNENVYFLAHIREPNLDIFVYQDWYVNESLVSTPFLPAGTAIMGNGTRNSNIFYYGAITLWEGDPATGALETFVDVPRVPRVYADIKSSKRFMEMNSRFLPVPQDLTEWGVLNIS